MTQKELVSSMFSTSDSLDELRYTRVILDAFWDRLADFPMGGLTDRQSKELENLLFLVRVYSDLSSTALDRLTEEFSHCLRTARE